jgi:hypothetical protein
MESENNDNQEIVIPLTPLPSPPKTSGKPLEGENKERPVIILSAIKLCFIFALSWWLNGLL